MNEKIKIMKPPQLSDEEIRSYMDFGKVLQQRRQVLARQSRLGWFAVLTALAVISAIIIWQMPAKEERIQREPQRSNVPAMQTDSLTRLENNDKSTSAEKTDDPLMKADVPTVKKNAVSKPEPESPIIAKQNDHARSNGDVRKSNKAGTIENESEETKEADVYIQAEPVDGYEVLYSYINSNLRYPAEALNDTIQGAVVVSFVITPNGKPDQIKIKEDLGEAFTIEVTRLIENMPAWKPATLNGKPVPSRITLPLTFRIEKISK